MGSFSSLKFFRDRWRIAQENPLFWYNVLLALGTILITVVFPGPVFDNGPSDFRIRAWGMALQLIGALTVWLDLTESARNFGRPSFYLNTVTWLKRLMYGNAVVTGATRLPIRIKVLGSGLSGRRDIPPADAPIENRVAAMEYNIQQIDSDLANAFNQMTTMETSFANSFQKEVTAREVADSQLKKKLHDAVIGNYSSLAFGAIWVAVGIVISALAPEIAKIVAGQWGLVWRSA